MSDWAIWMVEHSSLRHAEEIATGAPTNWMKVGENVGRGGAVASVWGAFMASPGHAANVLDPETLRDKVDLNDVRLLTDDYAPVDTLAFHVALDRESPR